MENIEKVQQFLESLDGSIDDLESKLHPIITQSLEEVIAPIDSPLERIEVYNNYAYVLVSLIYAYLKSTGVPLENHPIMKELERVKQYNKRHKDLVDNANKDSASQEKNNKQAQEFLTKTLGQKSGTDNTLGDTSPAISKGTHTKFT